MLAEWGATVFAFTVAVLAAHAIGHANNRVSFSCLVFVWSVAGGLFLLRHPAADRGVLLRGSLLYLASLIILMFCLAKLDLGTAKLIAQWYDKTGLGGSVGLLIFECGFAPLFFGLGPRKLQIRPGIRTR